jgi:Cu(I)/Ag(I) efflux system periplasmic protein CusF
MRTIIYAAALAFLGTTAPALAAEHQDHGKHQAGGAAAASASLTEGEVRKVDKEAKKLTIRHGPIANLDMPAMTMVFQVQDHSVLDSVKTGDKIRFQAEKSAGAYTVTKVEPAK